MSSACSATAASAGYMENCWNDWRDEKKTGMRLSLVLKRSQETHVTSARKTAALQSGDTDSPAHHENIKQGRTAAASVAPTATGLVRTCRRSSRCRSGRSLFRGDQDDLIIFRVQRAGFGARLGLHSLFHFKVGRAGFFDDRQRAVTLRTEGLHGVRVEYAAVRTFADGQGSDDFSIVGAEDDAGLRVAAHREENVILRVQGQAGRPATLAAKVVVRGDLEGFDIDDRHVVLVFDINIEIALAVAGGLFTRAAEINRAEDGAVLGVEHCGVRRTVAEHVN